MGGRGEGRKKMIYSNVNKTVETRKMSFGDLRGISLGKRGSGRKEIFLPVPRNFPQELPAGEVICGFSVGYSKTGRPRITTEDCTLALILDCEGDVFERTTGRVQGLVKVRHELVASAYWIGIWYSTILKAKDGDVFLVRKSGDPAKVGPRIVYLVSGNNVFHCELPLAEKTFKTLGKELPFTIIGGNEVNPDEWRHLVVH